MKRMLNLTSIFCFLLLSSLAYAGSNTYYVTQNGNGAKNGQSLGNAWSASDFNNSANWSATDNSNKIDPGDTVYFSGTITTRLTPKGSGSAGNTIVLDGYQAGDCDPIDSVCSSSVLLSGSSAGMTIINNDYLTVQDFRMTGGPNSNALILINSPSSSSTTADHVTIRRNYLYDANLGLLNSTRSSSYTGSDYLTIENNKMVGYGKAANSSQGVNFYYNKNLVVRKNYLSGGPNPDASRCDSDNVIEVHSNNYALFEYNDISYAYQQAGIAIKEPDPASQNIIFRFNKVHHNSIYTHYTDGESFGIAVAAHSNHIYIYGNYVYSNGNFGISAMRGTSYVYIWSNIVVNNGWAGIYTWTDSSGGINWGSNNNVYIYNNTIVNNATQRSETNSTGIAFTESSGSNRVVKNNILYNNRVNESTYNQIYVASGSTSGVTLDSNTYYYPGQTPTVYYNSGYRTIPSLQNSYNQEGTSPAGKVANPGFTDPSNNNYTLNGDNIGNGVDLSQCIDVSVQGQNYHICIDDALDPNATNWRATLPIVRTVKQGANGAWERGAYAYGTDGSGSPDINAPSGLKIIVGDN